MSLKAGNLSFQVRTALNWLMVMYREVWHQSGTGLISGSSMHCPLVIFYSAGRQQSGGWSFMRPTFCVQD